MPLAHSILGSLAGNAFLTHPHHPPQVCSLCAVFPLPIVSLARPPEEGLSGQLQTTGLSARVGGGFSALPQSTRGPHSLRASGI